MKRVGKEIHAADRKSVASDYASKSLARTNGIARNGLRLIHILRLLAFLAVAEGPQNPCGACRRHLNSSKRRSSASR